MKFSTREDIEAPIEKVFDFLSEFEVFERHAMRHGASVQRVGKVTTPQEGMQWDISFLLRGRRRDMRLTLATFQRASDIVIMGKSNGIDANFAIELIALSRTRTRMSVAVELKPLNLAARLLVQSLKLAKASLSKRFKLRVAEYAKIMEEKIPRGESA